MSNIIFIIEETKTGFSAYAKDYPVYTTGTNMAALKNNTLDAINSWFQHKGLPEILNSSIKLQTLIKI